MSTAHSSAFPGDQDTGSSSSTSKNTKRQKTAKGDESQTDSENESSSEMQTTFKRPRNKNSVTVEEMLKNFKRILKLQLEMIGNDYLQAEIRMVVAAYACNSIRKSLKNEKLSSESSALKEIDGFEDAPNLIVDNEGSSERNDLFVNFLAAEIKGIGKAIIQKKIMSRVQQRIATLVANVFDNSDIDTASTENIQEDVQDVQGVQGVEQSVNPVQPKTYKDRISEILEDLENQN